MLSISILGSAVLIRNLHFLNKLPPRLSLCSFPSLRASSEKSTKYRNQSCDILIPHIGLWSWGIMLDAGNGGSHFLVFSIWFSWWFPFLMVGGTLVYAEAENCYCHMLSRAKLSSWRDPWGQKNDYSILVPLKRLSNYASQERTMLFFRRNSSCQSIFPLSD